MEDKDNRRNKGRRGKCREREKKVPTDIKRRQKEEKVKKRDKRYREGRKKRKVNSLC